jgi:ABC-2 type transport system ATP-binding protein
MHEPADGHGPTVYLRAQDVQKRYGNVNALNGVSLEIPRGEILGLLGPNGAGKTTLVKILATLLRKDGGLVEILGLDTDRFEREARRLFGYVGQDTDRSAYARLTVRENLRFFGALRGLSRRRVEERIDELAAYFDFTSNLNKLFMHLSGGQKQTVVIIRSLLHDPMLVFLDEPTKGLDPIVARRIRGYLRGYVESADKAMLLTSHILSEVDEMAHRVALIKNGRIRSSGTPDALKAEVGARDFVDLALEDLTPSAIRRLEELPCVRLAERRDETWLSLGIDSFLEDSEEILQVLRTEDVHPAFRHRSVTLEDAFIYSIGSAGEGFDE